jgi:hypothetical protein
MAKGSAVATESTSDGMDGFVPSGASLLDAEIVGDGSDGFLSETPHGNSELVEVTGDPDTEELDEETEEEADDEETEEEEDGEPEVDPIASKKKGNSYWQSEHDKLAAKMKTLEGLEQYQVVIENLRSDPEAAKLLMEHWSGSSKPAPAKEPELVEPEPPEDFDINMISVRGSSSEKYWKEQRAYDRTVAAREAAQAAREAAEGATRPFLQQQANERQRAQMLGILSKTDLPAEEYESFMKWNPTPEELSKVLPRAYMELRGLKAKTTTAVSSKKEEFKKVKENSEKAGTVKKVKGSESNSGLSEEDGFMASLRSAATQFRYKS